MKKIITIIVLLFICFNANTSLAWDSTAAKFYPLNVGNHYVFEKYNLSFNCTLYQLVGFEIVDITSNTILSNGKKYFKFENWWWLSPSWMYQRIDSTSMNVYSYNINTMEEELLDSLCANVGDTFLGKRNIFNSGPCIVNDTSTHYILSANRIIKYINASGTVSMRYSLIEGIGFGGYSSCELGTGEAYILKGCIINGILYGDTSTTRIKTISNETPSHFNLHQNYPNPFNSQTTIEFDIKEKGNYKLVIYDCLGRKREELVNEYLNAGSYRISFNGNEFQSGVYFYRISADGKAMETRKMVLIK